MQCDAAMTSRKQNSGQAVDKLVAQGFQSAALNFQTRRYPRTEANDGQDFTGPKRQRRRVPGRDCAELE